MTAPIWQQEEGATRFELAPISPGSRAHLVMTTRDIVGLGPFALLDRTQAAALRDALTAWLDEGAARQGRKTLRVANLLALIEETPTRKEDE